MAFAREIRMCLHPLPLPSQVWNDISIDFTKKLPQSQGKLAIMIVVDRYSKFAHFILLQHLFTASKVAQVLFKETCQLYELPKNIRCDRDRFISAF